MLEAAQSAPVQEEFQEDRIYLTLHTKNQGENEGAKHSPSIMDQPKWE